MTESGLLGVGANDRVPAARVADMFEALMTAGIDWVRYGSGALMLAYVAAGRLVGYVEPRMCVWDCMAGYCLVEAAGGRTLPLRGGRRCGARPPCWVPRAAVFDEILHLCRLDNTGFWGGKAGERNRVKGDRERLRRSCWGGPAKALRLARRPRPNHRRTSTRVPSVEVNPLGPSIGAQWRWILRDLVAEEGFGLHSVFFWIEL